MVSISKLKRAKAIVMQKELDATKGQYQLLYRYQLVLLRSNHGSTVIVKKELQLELTLGIRSDRTDQFGSSVIRSVRSSET